MPGPQIKNWRVYEGLRRRGVSKRRAAKLANAGREARRRGGKRGGRKSGRRRRRRRG